MKQHPSLGREGRDIVSGFTGVITGYCQYMTGCSQFLLSPKVGEKGEYRSGNWYDEQRVELTTAPTIVLDPVRNAATPGPDLAPTRSH